MAQIAATAVVDLGAEVGEGVVIGPGCVVKSGVVIGEGCELRANVYVGTGTRIGKGNLMYCQCVIGEDPQILGLVNPATELVIGDANVFRENVTISRGSPHGGGRTVIGDHNFFMIGSHVGHDCEVEHHTVIGNYCQIAGHCRVEDHVYLSGFASAHQFVTLGRYCFMGGLAGTTHDIPPYVRVSGAYPCEVRGLNVVGLQRSGMAEASIKAVDRAYRQLYRRKDGLPLKAAVEELLGEAGIDEHVRYMLDFIQRSQGHRFNRYRELFRE